MRTYLAIIVSFFVLAIGASGMAQAQTDDNIRSILIEESISRYSGNCPCPEYRASNGSRCGKRSAWSRAGGAAPWCYPDDVSDAAVAAYRARHGGARVRDAAVQKPPALSVPTASPSAPVIRSVPSVEQSVEQLPDCPSGTTLARINGSYRCAELPGAQVRANEVVTSSRPFSSTKSQQSMTFTDVLSKLQAGGSAVAQPVAVPTEQPRERLSAPPAAGLLNCTGGTRVTYVDGRIECR
jgi:hypothetical protein